MVLLRSDAPSTAAQIVLLHDVGYDSRSSTAGFPPRHLVIQENPYHESQA